MKKLFLVSSFQDVADKLPAYEKELEGKTVTFIPTASKVEQVVFYVQQGRKCLERLGLAVEELDISTASTHTIRETIEKNHCIYVTGGNTFFLLQELKRTGADKVIVDAVNGGKLYIGESAGAMVTAENIAYVQPMDSAAKAPQLDSFEGLGLIPCYPVPHWGNPPFEQATQEIVDTYSTTLNLAPISNKNAIWLEDNRIEIL